MLPIFKGLSVDWGYQFGFWSFNFDQVASWAAWREPGLGVLLSSVRPAGEGCGLGAIHVLGGVFGSCCRCRCCWSRQAVRPLCGASVPLRWWPGPGIRSFWSARRRSWKERHWCCCPSPHEDGGVDTIWQMCVVSGLTSASLLANHLSLLPGMFILFPSSLLPFFSSMNRVISWAPSRLIELCYLWICKQVHGGGGGGMNWWEFKQVGDCSGYINFLGCTWMIFVPDATFGRVEFSRFIG